MIKKTFIATIFLAFSYSTKAQNNNENMLSSWLYLSYFRLQIWNTEDIDFQ
jgi:hypothetical protein